jgi:hypothetical protein
MVDLPVAVRGVIDRMVRRQPVAADGAILCSLLVRRTRPSLCRTVAAVGSIYGSPAQADTEVMSALRQLAATKSSR